MRKTTRLRTAALGLTFLAACSPPAFMREMAGQGELVSAASDSSTDQQFEDIFEMVFPSCDFIENVAGKEENNGVVFYEVTQGVVEDIGADTVRDPILLEHLRQLALDDAVEIVGIINDPDSPEGSGATYLQIMANPGTSDDQIATAIVDSGLIDYEKTCPSGQI